MLMNIIQNIDLEMTHLKLSPHLQGLDLNYIEYLQLPGSSVVPKA